MTSEILDHAEAGKILGIIDAASASRTATPRDVEGLLLRPFVPAELHRSIRRVLGLPMDTGVRGPILRRIEVLSGPPASLQWH